MLEFLVRRKRWGEVIRTLHTLKLHRLKHILLSSPDKVRWLLLNSAIKDCLCCDLDCKHSDIVTLINVKIIQDHLITLNKELVIDNEFITDRIVREWLNDCWIVKMPGFKWLNNTSIIKKQMMLRRYIRARLAIRLIKFRRKKSPTTAVTKLKKVLGIIALFVFADIAIFAIYAASMLDKDEGYEVGKILFNLLKFGLDSVF